MRSGASPLFAMQEELALIIPRALEQLNENHAGEAPEPIAERNFSRKKVAQLEQGIDKLSRTTRQQHEVVSTLEKGMKTMISETDLRRALGIAFQEFEDRLEEAFQDSNRRCLAMFSKQDEVAEMQAKLAKKVSWTDYNSVLTKLLELRQHVDTMAESVFVGHRNLLKGEISKKADVLTVDKALETKAGCDDVNDIRAKLEGLESLVARHDMLQCARLQALREDSEAMIMDKSRRQEELIAESVAQIQDLSANHRRLEQCLTGDGTPGGGIEGRVGALSRAAERLGEEARFLRQRQDIVVDDLAAVRDRVAVTEDGSRRSEQAFQGLVTTTTQFQDASQQKFGELAAHATASRENIEFLMQATEMIKRKAREAAKTTTGKFQEESDARESLGKQVTELERWLQRQERELRALEGRCSKAIEDGPLRALPAPQLEIADSNERLQGMLEQLGRIATGGRPLEQLGAEWSKQRPPLPCRSDLSKHRSGADGDLVPKLPRYDATEPAPIDSARSCSAGRGVYVSPRGAHAHRRR